MLIYLARLFSPYLLIYKKPHLLASCKTHLAKAKYSALNLVQYIVQFVTVNSAEYGTKA
jgi:hypothetical protein